MSAQSGCAAGGAEQQQGENATTYLEGLTKRALRDVDPWWNQDVTTEA